MGNPEIIVCDCIPADIREMARVMHPRSIETAEKAGIAPHKALWRSWKESIYCKSVFLNGKIAAIFGIGGVLFGEIGSPWLILTPEVEEYPMRVAFAYKQELKKMQTMFPLLEDWVDETHDKAIRMLKLMGFRIESQKIKIGDANMLRAVRS